MDIMKQPLHPRVWAWLELAIEAGVDGQGPIFASAKWATETSSSHLVQSALPEKEKMMMMMMMMILKGCGCSVYGVLDPIPRPFLCRPPLQLHSCLIRRGLAQSAKNSIQVGIMWIKKKER